MAPETAPRFAPLALWRGARAFLVQLFGLFGEPKDIALAHVFDARLHALITSWLRAGEAILRQLLLIEVEALPEGGLDAPTRAQCQRTPRDPAAINLEQPETWRISSAVSRPPLASPARAVVNARAPSVSTPPSPSPRGWKRCCACSTIPRRSCSA